MRILKRIFVNFEEVVAGSALFLMTACVFFNTFGRIFFKKSFAALDELSYLFFAYVIFVGSSALYKRSTWSYACSPRKFRLRSVL